MSPFVTKWSLSRSENFPLDGVVAVRYALTTKRWMKFDGEYTTVTLLSGSFFIRGLEFSTVDGKAQEERSGITLRM